MVSVQKIAKGVHHIVTGNLKIITGVSAVIEFIAMLHGVSEVVAGVQAL